MKSYLQQNWTYYQLCSNDSIFHFKSPNLIFKIRKTNHFIHINILNDFDCFSKVFVNFKVLLAKSQLIETLFILCAF